MPIKLACPRCTKMLSLGDELAGQYTFCAHCQGRVWVPAADNHGESPVPANGADAAQPREVPFPDAKNTDVAKTTILPPPFSPSPTQAESQTSSREPKPVDPVAESNEPPETGTQTSGVNQSNAASRVPPKTDSPQQSPKHVAKFITTDVAESRIEVAADGKLPELQLSTDHGKTQDKKTASSTNPWGLVLLICGSLIASTALLLIGPSSNTTSQHSSVERARILIQDKYFGPNEGPRKQYQEYLRDALLARSQGNRSKEEHYYRKVIYLLRAEHLDADPDERGLTGQRYRSTDDSLPSDPELHNLLSILLNKH